MTNYIIERHVLGSRKSRTCEYEYSIKKNGKSLHDGCAKMLFTTKKKAEEFADRFNEETADANRYRWL